ncbi:TPA: DUF2326 domain-containing protein, partial [Pseudomonas aeruginosa]|nr:DUF2326 domain-containing protein [Pseudomonas aeruginosa]
WFSMRLNKVLVVKNGDVLREVFFNDGLNLIINKSSGVERTGNSVGKSTLSRVLDYLFLSDGEDIYTEPEFGRLIPEVHSFIESNQITVFLDFIGLDNNNHVIGRELTVRQASSFFIVNSETVSRREYMDFVAQKVFGLVTEKPSLRTVVHKFIRNTHEKMQKTTRFLHVNTKPDVYDQLYLFLFGFGALGLLRDKAILNNKIKTKRKHLAAYRDPYKESALEKMLAPLKDEERIIQEKIDNFDFSDSQEDSVQELVQIQRLISELTIEYSTYLSRVDYLRRSIESLKENAAKVDGRELSSIYKDAGVSISSELKRSYEDLVAFHNRLISNKINLISRDIIRYEDAVSELKGKIEDMHLAESRVFKGIKEPEILKSIGQVYNELSDVKERMAAIGALLEKIQDAKEIIASLEGSKAAIVSEISRSADEFNNNVAIFNKEFSSLSKLFYGERYLFDLEFDVEEEKCVFDIASVSPNSTGGKKKGELSAFDLAYIKFVREVGLRRPTFVIHDSIEDVDVNQVYDIFTAANGIPGQYIVAVLSDKISDSRFEGLKDGSVILELSEADKFFKI